MIEMGKSIRHKWVNNMTVLRFMHFHLYQKHNDKIHFHLKQKMKLVPQIFFRHVLALRTLLSCVKSLYQHLTIFIERLMTILV